MHRLLQRQFMAAGSLTLGGNMSLAVGPLGRNGEASGAVNSSGKVAAMSVFLPFPSLSLPLRHLPPNGHSSSPTV